MSVDRKAMMCCLLAVRLICPVVGCGTTKSYVATEQLLLSDAVDAAMDEIDFTPLAGHKLYLDTAPIPTQRTNTGLGLVSSEYLIGSLRQRMLLSGCLLAPNREAAEIIVEARVGAYGTDGHSVMVGVPALNSSQTNASHESRLPSLPELSLARRESMAGKVKLGLFAYRQKSREVVWQSGIAQSGSDANDTWILGVGPMQRGSIHAADPAMADQRSVGRSILRR